MLWCCDDARAAGGGVDVGRRAALMVLQIRVKKALLSSHRLHHVHLRLTPPSPPPLHNSLSLHRKTPLPRTGLRHRFGIIDDITVYVINTNIQIQRWWPH